MLTPTAGYSSYTTGAWGPHVPLADPTSSSSAANVAEEPSPQSALTSPRTLTVRRWTVPALGISAFHTDLVNQELLADHRQTQGSTGLELTPARMPNATPLADRGAVGTIARRILPSTEGDRIHHPEVAGLSTPSSGCTPATFGMDSRAQGRFYIHQYLLTCPRPQTPQQISEGLCLAYRIMPRAAIHSCLKVLQGQGIVELVPAYRGVWSYRLTEWGRSLSSASSLSPPRAHGSSHSLISGTRASPVRSSRRRPQNEFKTVTRLAIMLAGRPLSLGEVYRQLNPSFTMERLIVILRNYPGFTKHPGCVAHLDTLWEYNSTLAGVAPFTKEPVEAVSTTSVTGAAPPPLLRLRLAPDSTAMTNGDRRQGPKRLYGTAPSAQDTPAEALGRELANEPQTKYRRITDGPLPTLVHVESSSREEHAAERTGDNCGPDSAQHRDPSVEARGLLQANQFVDILNDGEESTPLIPYDGLWPAHYDTPAYLSNEAKSPPRQALPSPSSLTGSVEGEQDGSEV